VEALEARVGCTEAQFAEFVRRALTGSRDARGLNPLVTTNVRMALEYNQLPQEWLNRALPLGRRFMVGPPRPFPPGYTPFPSDAESADLLSSEVILEPRRHILERMRPPNAIISPWLPMRLRRPLHPPHPEARPAPAGAPRDGGMDLMSRLKTAVNDAEQTLKVRGRLGSDSVVGGALCGS
jgi:hypothetical protein